MRVAVFTLTRDRLEYTQHCFQRLHELAGCPFDHYVLDQGSVDGTREWLHTHADSFQGLITMPENVGIPVGLNRLLDLADPTAYDVIVKVDNDCELLDYGTLRDCALLALAGDVLLSPRIAGLLQPPASIGEFVIDGRTILDIPQIGGIFTAIPAHAFERFRYPERGLLHDDVDLCRWWRQQGGRCGYVRGLVANHYETTDGQRARYPDYFTRKDAEYVRP